MLEKVTHDRISCDHDKVRPFLIVKVEVLELARAVNMWEK